MSDDGDFDDNESRGMGAAAWLIIMLIILVGIFFLMGAGMMVVIK